MRQLFFPVFTLLFAQLANASPLTDFYIRQALDRYFELPEDARTLGMAGSSGVTCSGSSCMFLNPAGLGKVKSLEVSSSLGFSVIGGDEILSDEDLEQSQYYGYFVAAFPLGEMRDHRAQFGVIDVGYSRYDGRTDDSINTTPDGHRRSIAYAYSPSDCFSLGYAFHFYDDQLRSEFADLHSHSRLLHIWGMQFRSADDFEVSTDFKLGIGQSDTEDFRFDSDGLSHLRSYAGEIGLARTISGVVIALSFDYTRVSSDGTLEEVALPVVIGGNEEGNVYNLRFGVEHEIAEVLVVRAGLRLHEVEGYTFERPDLGSLSGTVQGIGYSAGLGYAWRSSPEAAPTVTFDYGVQYLSIGHGAWDHVLTVTLPIGL